MKLLATSKSTQPFNANPSGFTLLEVLVSIGILTIFFGLSFASLNAMYKTTRLRGGSDAVASAVSTAALRARSGLHGSDWGVYLDYDEMSRVPVRATVFAGASYVTRDTTHDIVYELEQSPVFTSVSLSGLGVSGGSDHEVVFSALQGTTTQFGVITLTAEDAATVITISPTGVPTRQ